MVGTVLDRRLTSKEACLAVLIVLHLLLKLHLRHFSKASL